eukprot:Em0014g467a
MPSDLGIQQLEEKNLARNQRKAKETASVTEVQVILSAKQKRSVEIASEKGASSWLNALPIARHGFALHKSAFRDAICLRYGWQPPLLPSHCICGSIYTVEHAMNCPSGGFPSIRHNEVRDLTSAFLSENFCGKDHQTAYFDVRIFNPFAQSYANSSMSKCYRKHELDKKREYEERTHVEKLNEEMTGREANTQQSLKLLKKLWHMVTKGIEGKCAIWLIERQDVIEPTWPLYPGTHISQPQLELRPNPVPHLDDSGCRPCLSHSLQNEQLQLENTKLQSAIRNARRSIDRYQCDIQLLESERESLATNNASLSDDVGRAIEKQKESEQKLQESLQVAGDELRTERLELQSDLLTQRSIETDLRRKSDTLNNDLEKLQLSSAMKERQLCELLENLKLSHAAEVSQHAQQHQQLVSDMTEKINSLQAALMDEQALVLAIRRQQLSMLDGQYKIGEDLSKSLDDNEKLLRMYLTMKRQLKDIPKEVQGDTNHAADMPATIER